MPHLREQAAFSAHQQGGSTLIPPIAPLQAQIFHQLGLIVTIYDAAPRTAADRISGLSAR
jgi:hypothetical protein